MALSRLPARADIIDISILKVSKAKPLSTLKVSIKQIKAARALLGWSQEALAEASQVSLPTIKRLEAGDGELGGRSSTATKLVDALIAGGIEFISDDGGGLGVRLKSSQPN